MTILRFGAIAVVLLGSAVWASQAPLTTGGSGFCTTYDFSVQGVVLSSFAAAIPASQFNGGTMEQCLRVRNEVYRALASTAEAAEKRYEAAQEHAFAALGKPHTEYQQAQASRNAAESEYRAAAANASALPPCTCVARQETGIER